MYRGLYVDKPQSVRIHEEQEAPLQPHEVRIRTTFASVKHGTEFHLFSGESPFQDRRFDTQRRLFVKKEEGEQPDIFTQHFVGNMVVGTVIEIGQDVSKVRSGDTIYCYGPACELVTKTEEEVELLRTPMSAWDAMCLDPALFAFAAVRDSGARLGNNVVVFGLGAIGLLIVQMLQLSGCAHIVAVDPIEKRRTLAREFGATTVVDPTLEDIGLITRELFDGQGADIAIEASGNYSALHGAMRAVRNCARVVTLGYYKGRDTVLELGAEWHHNRLELISSMPVWNNPSREYPHWDRQRITRTLVDMFLQKRLTSEGIIDPIVPFADAATAFLDIYHNPVHAIKLGISFSSGGDTQSLTAKEEICTSRTMKSMHEPLAQQAIEVLRKNWTGAFTKPGALLYHHQWSWDSAFVAIGTVHYDQARAEQEIRSLFQGQWANGLLPHIIFDPDATIQYFPSFEFWETGSSLQAPRDQQTSGIVQPPVHATAILHIYRHAQDTSQALTFLKDMFAKLQTWHAYLHRERDPQGEGLVYIRHPWESLDNSPIWDTILRRMRLRPEDVPAYTRVDTQTVNAADRPSDDDYDRYAYLVRFFSSRGYDEAKIRLDCPFLVQDVLFNALLCQADRDLAEIARIVGKDPTPFEKWAEQTSQAVNSKLWDEDHGIYVDFDLVENKQIHVQSAAGFLPLFAGIPDTNRAQRMYSYLNSRSFCGLDEACYALPSYDRQAPDFSPNRYWRGPVWINLDWLLYYGLHRYGFLEYAQRVRQSVLDLVQQHGFYEYYNPLNGEGHGTHQFSWTAALLLDML